jgi:hypothetical protein
MCKAVNIANIYIYIYIYIYARNIELHRLNCWDFIAQRYAWLLRFHFFIHLHPTSTAGNLASTMPMFATWTKIDESRWNLTDRWWTQFNNIALISAYRDVRPQSVYSKSKNKRSSNSESRDAGAIPGLERPLESIEAQLSARVIVRYRTHPWVTR